jgi:hypothetical protein
MMFLNKWNQREIYSEILIGYFLVRGQTMDGSLKLLENLFKDSNYLWYVMTKLNQCVISCLLVSIFHDFFHYVITFVLLIVRATI